ncbi:hypothetical protein [Paenibacillus sp. URB8-2]|uniref:hypothetical protein n=1 Tax=Paenibacillus sp. URB8-2 TaxID=2741301 RepID=UPI0015BCAFF6|nr:hypothetical protein [Paenibacillus sp. URB8-2]
MPLISEGRYQPFIEVSPRKTGWTEPRKNTADSEVAVNRTAKMCGDKKKRLRRPLEEEGIRFS